MISEYKLKQVVSKFTSLAVTWKFVSARKDIYLNSIEYDYDLCCMSVKISYPPAYHKEDDDWKTFNLYIPDVFDDESVDAIAGYCFGCILHEEDVDEE